jgi:hypothetical protein
MCSACAENLKSCSSGASAAGGTGGAADGAAGLGRGRGGGEGGPGHVATDWTPVASKPWYHRYPKIAG